MLYNIEISCQKSVFPVDNVPASPWGKKQPDIKAKLEQLINANSAKELEKVTGDVVKEACCRMKPSKADVTESYTSDVFLNAPEYLFELLAVVFRSCLTYGTVTHQILSCAFLPLFKGGLESKFDPYRAIAGAS